MKYIGFNGRQYNINPTDYIVYGDDELSRSSLHLRARQILKKLFPKDIILEEISLPGSSKGSTGTLRLDFLIETYKLAIEVHGEQHYKFNSHFFKDKHQFLLALKRDSVKMEWCEMNEISLVELPYSENDNEWKRRIRESVC
jgi:hypothetical protein